MNNKSAICESSLHMISFKCKGISIYIHINGHDLASSHCHVRIPEGNIDNSGKSRQNFFAYRQQRHQFAFGQQYRISNVVPGRHTSNKSRGPFACSCCKASSKWRLFTHANESYHVGGAGKKMLIIVLNMNEVIVLVPGMYHLTQTY